MKANVNAGVEARSVACSIAPMLSVRNGARAVEFYKAAFGASEVYRVEDPGGAVVSRLAVDGAAEALRLAALIFTFARPSLRLPKTPCPPARQSE
jgi:catechol 2,3-dioxygenase-like lactoylglutathione lyase family enzyme